MDEMCITQYGEVPLMAHYVRAEINGITSQGALYSRPQKTCSRCVTLRNGICCLVIDTCSFNVNGRKVAPACPEPVIRQPAFRNVTTHTPASMLRQIEISVCTRLLTLLSSVLSIALGSSLCSSVLPCLPLLWRRRSGHSVLSSSPACCHGPPDFAALRMPLLELSLSLLCTKCTSVQSGICQKWYYSKTLLIRPPLFRKFE